MIDLSRKILLAMLIASVGSVPSRKPKSPFDKAFVGEGSRDLAKALLQGFVDQNENMAYSPLGYSAVLAIFAEGARGNSRDEIALALHFPKDVEAVRLAYKSILQKFDGKRGVNEAEFKNYFYVYKNYTINQDLSDVLEKYYQTEVKSVTRLEDYPPKEDEPTKTEPIGEEEEEIAVVEEVSPVSTEKKTPEKDDLKVPKQRSFVDGEVKFKEHFSGMTDSSLKIRGKGPQSQMIIFNGLYFKGDWKEPFVKKPAEESKAFYKSEKEKISTPTIHSAGEFLTGSIEGLDCRAIELPYKGGRYSLLILVPNTRDGLARLISDLAVYPITDIYKQLKTRPVDVSLPSFDMDCISKPISSFRKLGLSKVTSIFDPEKADLSGITSEPGLYVEELVQMVSFKVDADYSSTSFLSSSLASGRINFEPFQINQPFLFFLKDKVDNIIVVNGKLVDPTPRPNPFTF